MHSNGYLQHSQVHIVGVSLGAHVAGHVGKFVKNGKINAIFGNDPAGPLFSLDNPATRLASGDAVYTEAIHTNAGTLGITGTITDAAFYPNWGSSQPGCGTDIAGNCAHMRASSLYSESVNSNLFRARRCVGHAEIAMRLCPGTGEVATMGGDAAKRINGVFFLETKGESPFALG